MTNSSLTYLPHNIIVSFQNTLGKLPVFSLSNPRKVIDAVQKTFDADEVKSSTPSREAFRKRRITLYALEKVI